MAERPITIAIDAMGGYHAPADVVAAVAQASQVGDESVYFLLVGDEVRISDALYQAGHNPERISVVHAGSFVQLGEPAAAALEQKRDASVAMACALVAHGDADAVVTAGHPGAAVLAALEHLKMLPGATRAALASVYPTPRARGPQNDRLGLILDVGATMRARPEDLVCFASMGSAYARVVKGIERPRVALLSNSREARVGPPEIVAAYELLRAHPSLNFYGNVEGDEIPKGDYDVIVCEGFVGDVALKLLEGTGEAAFELARSAYERKMAWRMGLRLLSGGLKKIKTATDFEEYGGAPLLGVDGVVILAHPKSRKKAVGNALKLAIKNVRAGLTEQVAHALRE
ncbi:MAG: phosphate acyltransferase PlsX [bacterium]